MKRIPLLSAIAVLFAAGFVLFARGLAQSKSPASGAQEVQPKSPQIPSPFSTLRKLDAFVRAGRVSGNGAAPVGADVQQEHLKAWAARNHITIGKIEVQQSVSVGREEIQSRALKDLMLRVSTGKSDGIIVNAAQSTGAPAMLWLKWPRRAGVSNQRRVEDGQCVLMDDETGEYWCYLGGRWYQCYRDGSGCNRIL